MFYFHSPHHAQFCPDIMNSDFDVIIVGSGPAGTSAAYPLVESGLRVLMVDGGKQIHAPLPAEPFLAARKNDGQQWKWMLGENFHALKMREAISPKLRVPAHEPIFSDFIDRNRIDAKSFVAVGSLAAGGLSNAWGCGVAKMSGEELADFPFSPTDIEPSYEAVVRRIGVSGPQQDDLSDYFGLDEWSQPPIPMDPLHTYLHDQYLRQKPKFSSLRFRLGRFRVAAISEDHRGRKACNRSGNCLWGCYRRALYSAADELPYLKRHDNFTYEAGFVVDDITRQKSFMALHGKPDRSGVQTTVTARKVILAAGTLATTRLALQAVKFNGAVRLLSCPTAAFMVWLPSMMRQPKIPAFGYGQLAFVLPLNNSVSALGATFVTSGLPLSEFTSHLPLARRWGIDFLKGLLNSCLVGNLFLPGHLSDTKAHIDENGRLRIEGRYSEEVPKLMSETRTQLRRAYRHLGAYLLPMSFTVGNVGGDIHYAGTLPMRKAPDLGETSASGEIQGLENVYIADGACLPTLSEKSHTLTIMANADRIGRIVAKSLSARL